jgi:hypothetical protein
VTASPSSPELLRIEYVPLEQIAPAVRNPKKHDLPGMVASIEEHGFADTPILDERTQRFVAGHGRCEALVHMKANGDPMPKGLILNDDGEWCLPIQRGWSSKSDAHAEAFIIAHNRLTEAGGWDNPMLTEMLHDVNAYDPELFDGIGFTADEMDELFRTVDPERFDQDPDALPSQDTSGITVEDAGESEGRRSPDEPMEVECPMCYHQFDANRNKVHAS